MPAPGPEPDAARVERIDHEVRLWDRIAPEYLTMHENGGALPIECIFVTAHEFASEHWSGVHHVPSYNKWLVRHDLRDAYRWHRRHLEWLGQHDAPGRQWVLKAPSHLGALPALFATYPDAWILQTHRDPLRTIPSTISLMATLRWMRSDVVDVDALARTMAVGVAMLFDAVAGMRADATLPDARFVDVHYADLVRDPVATLRGVYERTGRPWPDGARRAHRRVPGGEAPCGPRRPPVLGRGVRARRRPAARALPALRRALRHRDRGRRPARSGGRPGDRGASRSGPSSASAPYARRMNRWRSCSQVKPIPPWIWMPSFAARVAACPAAALATWTARWRAWSSASMVMAAWYTALHARSTSRLMSASLCWIAWNEPIGTSNCTRSFA